MINSYLAWSCRYEFGLLLSPNAEYSNPRLKEIAQEMDSLNERWNALDEEIKAIRIAEHGPIIEENNED